MGLNQSQIYYDKGKSVEHYYLCHYRPKSVGSDRLSNSLLRFKRGLKYDLQAWVDCAINALKLMDIPKDVIILRAIGSNETVVTMGSNNALDKLGTSIAEAFDLNWLPHLICKSKYTRPLKYLNSADRILELKNAYYLSPNYFDLENRRILLIDDIITTGATVRSIIGLVKQYYPNSKFKVFTLARSTYVNLNTEVAISGTSYAWQDDAGWMAAEDEESYKSYAELTEHILRDDFSYF